MATDKQKRGVMKTLENIGNSKPLSQGKILEAVGYSKAIAKNPQMVVESKGWIQLMDKYLTDDNTAQVHKDMLNAKRVIKLSFSGETLSKHIYRMISQIPGATLIHVRDFKEGGKVIRKTALVAAPDNFSRKDALEMVYKLKNRFAPETGATVNNFLILSADEVKIGIANL